MRLLMLNHNVIERGGTYYRAMNLGRHLAKRGHEVTLLTIAARRHFRVVSGWMDGVRVVETPDILWGRGRTGWDPYDAVRRCLWLRGKRFDVVHAFDSRPVVILPALVAKRRGAALVLDWADWWGRGGTQTERPGRIVKFVYSPLETWFEETFRSRADGSTVASRLLGERAMSLGVTPTTIHWLPGGSEAPQSSEGRLRLRRADLGIAEADFLVGYVGAATLGDAKLLFDSFAHLTRFVTRARLLTVGASIAGSGRSFKEEIPAELIRRVIVIPRVQSKEVVRYLSLCDVLVLPLRDTLANRARWPSRIGDYLTAGRPIVATAVSDAAELFNGEIGILSADDPIKFGEAVASLSRHPDAAIRYGRNATQMSGGSMSWSSIAGGLESFYLQVLGDRTGLIEARA